MLKRVLVAGLLLSLLFGTVVLAAPEGDRRKQLRKEEAVKILHGLEMGIEALKALGKHDEAERIGRIAEGLRARLEGKHRGDDERAIVKRRIEIMRVAMHGLLEAEKKDLAHRLEHAIHAYELALEGRRDDEAMRIRKSAPDKEQQAEIMIYASKLWAEFGHEKKAEMVESVARELLGKGKHRKQERRGGERPSAERQALARRIEIMMVALPALMEGEKRDAADLLERAIHAYRMAYEGRRDREALHIVKKAPSKGQQAEILMLAARLWKEFENPKKAKLCHELALELAGKERGRDHSEGKRGERERREGQHREGGDHRIEELTKKLAHLHKMMEELRRELDKLRHDRR